MAEEVGGGRGTGRGGKVGRGSVRRAPFCVICSGFTSFHCVTCLGSNPNPVGLCSSAETGRHCEADPLRMMS